ncbi:hypothetical protein AVEN_168531-1, partial [Araneus ventricosus]
IGNALLQRSKSAAMGESQRKCQNGYQAAEGTSDASLVPQRQINCNSSKTFSIRVSKLSVSKSKVSIKGPETNNFDTLGENIFALLELMNQRRAFCCTIAILSLALEFSPCSRFSAQ